jgi:hypothetical protein
MRLSRHKTSLLSLAVLTALSSPVLAQVKVDGAIDPAEWQGARHVTDFRMVQPFTQSATRHPTEAWILATPDGLAVAFRNTKIAGVETPRQRSARDQDVAIDRVNVMLDFDGDGRSGYDFTLTASDSIQDSTITGGGNFSSDWDGSWQHAVVDGEGEWTAELLIPWHTAPMKKATGDKRTVAVYLDRVVGSVGERMAWPAVTFERPQFLNQFEKIEIPVYSQSLLAITPYVVGLHDLVSRDNQFDAGADIFWKPNSQFQLTATINPDFGQVESDSLVVNFGAQETFFSDKRPFFTENQGFFDFGLLFDNSQLLYTRRIGAASDDCLRAGATCSGPADITGAIKFNGSIGATQYGAFLADEGGDGGRRFSALRLQRAFGAHNLGAMLTNVDRPLLDRSANVLGFDHRWQPDPSLTVSSTLVGSDIEQAGQHVRDFAFTSIAQKTLDKGWSLTGLLIHYGEDFEINDAGYLGRNDLNYGAVRSRQAHHRPAGGFGVVIAQPALPHRGHAEQRRAVAAAAVPLQRQQPAPRRRQPQLEPATAHRRLRRRDHPRPRADARAQRRQCLHRPQLPAPRQLGVRRGGQHRRGQRPAPGHAVCLERLGQQHLLHQRCAQHRVVVGPRDGPGAADLARPRPRARLRECRGRRLPHEPLRPQRQPQLEHRHAPGIAGEAGSAGLRCR